MPRTVWGSQKFLVGVVIDDVVVYQFASVAPASILSSLSFHFPLLFIVLREQNWFGRPFFFSDVLVGSPALVLPAGPSPECLTSGR